MRVGVVGAGITGLVASLLLARRGHAVTLLEAGDFLGGVARSIGFSGHRFCPGPQYVWGFGDEGPATRILRSVGIDVACRPMPADFEQYAVDQSPWCAPTTSERAEDESLAGSSTSRSLAQLTAALDRLGHAGEVIAERAGFRESGAAMMRAVARSPRLGLSERLELARCRNLSVAELALRYGVSTAELRRLAYAQGIFAERLDALSAIVFAAARHHLLRAVYVPLGGMVTLVDELITAVKSAPGIEVRPGEAVLEVRQAAGGQRIDTRRGSVEVDRVLFCCSPGVVAAFHPPLRDRFEPANPIGAMCLRVELSDADCEALRHRNFSWFACERADVDFACPSEGLETINFTSPTLNGGGMGSHQVLCAFFPVSRTAHDEARPEAARELLRTLLARRLGHDVELTDSLYIGHRDWSESFGAYQGGAYGRRLTSRSLQRSLVSGLPREWSLAHSGAGIPGVLGCLQSAEAVVDEMSP